jgi:hypothetical protein
MLAEMKAAVKKRSQKMLTNFRIRKFRREEILGG